MGKLSKIGLILITISFIAGHVYGQEGNFATINVYPVSKTLVLSKGETVKGVLTIQNMSGKAQHVEVLPRQWHMTEENLDIPLALWFKMDINEFYIEPNKEKEIGYKITVPKDIRGELATMVAFKPERQEGQSVNVVFSVSVYVRIKDEGDIKYSMSDFKLWKYEDRKALGVDVTFNNEGNVHLKPRTQVFIQDLFNKNLNKAPLKYGKPVYPGKSQKYSGSIYNFELKPGMYKAMIDTEFANVAERFRKKVYFVVGKDGEIIFKFFRGRR